MLTLGPPALPGRAPLAVNGDFASGWVHTLVSGCAGLVLVPEIGASR